MAYMECLGFVFFDTVDQGDQVGCLNFATRAPRVKSPCEPFDTQRVWFQSVSLCHTMSKTDPNMSQPRLPTFHTPEKTSLCLHESPEALLPHLRRVFQSPTTLPPQLRISASLLAASSNVHGGLFDGRARGALHAEAIGGVAWRER